MGRSKITITKEEYWTYIKPVDFVLPDNWDECGGKLMIFGGEEFILSLVEELKKYIADGLIRSLKYAPPVEGLYHSWGLMVYCLDSESDSVWGILSNEGVSKRIWKYDRQTERDWDAGGRLSRKLGGKRSKNVKA